MKLVEEFIVKGRGKVISAVLEPNEPYPSVGSIIEWNGKWYEIRMIDSQLRCESTRRTIVLSVHETPRQETPTPDKEKRSQLTSVFETDTWCARTYAQAHRMFSNNAKQVWCVNVHVGDCVCYKDKDGVYELYRVVSILGEQRVGIMPWHPGKGVRLNVPRSEVLRCAKGS